MMKGIDVAKWNVVSDYRKLRGNGVEFAVVKVINKSNNADDRFRVHIAGFTDAGIDCSMGYTYSYSTTTAKAAKAAQAFVDVAKPYGIRYMWLDIEDTCMQGIGHTLVDVINVYKSLATNNGMGFGIYTYSSFFESYIRKYINELDGVKFWMARYPSTSTVSLEDDTPDKKCLPSGITISGWQYTSNGRIGGVEGSVDLDVWYEAIQTGGTDYVSSDYNPFTEPESNCTVGTIGNDANWVLWYLWRFGKLLDQNGNPDSGMINSLYSVETSNIVKEVQQILGLKADGIVGKITRSVFKKLA